MEAMMPSGGCAKVLHNTSLGVKAPKQPVIGEYIGAVAASAICGLGGLDIKTSILVFAFMIIVFEELSKAILKNQTQKKNRQFLERLDSIKFLRCRSVGTCDVQLLQEKLGKKYKVNKSQVQEGALSIDYKNDEYIVYDNQDESFSIRRISRVDRETWEIENVYGSVAFNLQQIVNQGQQVKSVRHEDENKPSVKDHIILVVKILLIIMSVVIMFSNDDNRCIAMVKSGTLSSFPDRPIGETLDSITVSPEWEYYEKRGEEYVRFSGRSEIFGKGTGKMRLQIDFLVFEEDGTFQIDRIEVDGDKLNDRDTSIVINAVFGSEEDD